jgi:hypothetical protein
MTNHPFIKNSGSKSCHKKTPAYRRGFGKNERKSQDAVVQTHTDGPSSPIQTITVGLGISPNPAQRLAGFTADRESHPTPKKGNFV